MKNSIELLKEGKKIYGTVMFVMPANEVDVRRDDGGWTFLDTGFFENGRVTEGDRVVIEIEDGKIKAFVVGEHASRLIGIHEDELRVLSREETDKARAEAKERRTSFK